jgi:hypothetical protein
MAERGESDQEQRDRKDAEKAAMNLERQYRQGVIERPKTKAKGKDKDKEAESEA